MVPAIVEDSRLNPHMPLPTPHLLRRLCREHIILFFRPPKYSSIQSTSVANDVLHVFKTPDAYLLLLGTFGPRSDRPADAKGKQVDISVNTM